MKPIFTLFLFLSILNLSAQTGAKPTKLSLEDCYQIAMEKNLDIQFTQKQEQFAKSGVSVAKSAYLPNADMSINYSRHLNVQENGAQSFNLGGIVFQTPGTPARPNSYSLNAQLSYTIFNGFNREYSIDKSIINQEQVANNRRNTIETVKYNIFLNYISISQTSQIVKIRKENLQVGQLDLERIKAQFAAGTVPESNVFAQESELANRELDLVRAENDHNIAKAKMLSLLGLNPDGDSDFKIEDIPIELSDSEIVNYYVNSKNLDNLIANALNNRFDYKTNKQNIEKLKLDVEISKASYYPSVFASTGWNWNNFELKDLDIGRSTAGLSLQIPIFQQFRVDYQVEAAQIQYEEAQKNLKQSELSLRNSLKSNLLTLEAAMKQLDIAKKSIAAAQQNYESVKARFEAGLLSINDFTIANANFINSKVNRINAIYNYMIAKKDLEFNSGNYKQ